MGRSTRVELDIETLERKLEAEASDESSMAGYYELLEARRDTLDELIELSRSTTNMYAAGPALIVGICRAAGAGESLPRRANKLFGSKPHLAQIRGRYGRLTVSSYGLFEPRRHASTTSQ